MIKNSFKNLICFSLHVFACIYSESGARYGSVVRVFAPRAMGHRIDPSWVGPVELFLVPASAPQLV